ncbi:MAG: PQQ-dependent sugar dehydrogenase [Acidimicrobiales bacterium]|nr:PQQ-dependent sugar dehydrogenase [Acidimicrobiales bacterium]
MSGTTSSSRTATADTRVPPPAVTASNGAISLEGVLLRVDRVGALSAASALAARKGYPNLYVAERAGRIRQVTVNHQLDSNGNIRKTDYLIERSPLLDISRQLRTGENLGLLGLAFSGDGRQLYVSFTPTDGGLRVDEYTMDDDRVDTRSRRTILEIDHHTDGAIGGAIAIGPDGFLYVATGDPSGGPAQDPHSLLGKVLRVDPQGGGDDQPYGIPDANPFRDGAAGAPEVWLSGLRDPGSIAFDTRSGDMWLTDHGETIEEINVLRAPGGPGSAGRGANLGWGRIEGAHGARTAAPDGHIAPIFEYNRDRGECPLVGGILYRGKAVPGLNGAYIFGDRCSGVLRGLLAATSVILDQRELGIVTGGELGVIATGPDGEVWLSGAAGELYRVEPGP